MPYKQEPEIRIHLFLSSVQKTCEIQCSRTDTFTDIVMAIDELLQESIHRCCILNRDTAVFEYSQMTFCSMDVPLASMNVQDGMFFLVL